MSNLKCGFHSSFIAIPQGLEYRNGEHPLDVRLVWLGLEHVVHELEQLRVNRDSKLGFYLLVFEIIEDEYQEVSFVLFEGGRVDVISLLEERCHTFPL